ncbi:galactonate dehydratase [Paracoccus thiocyanatus]|uniref:Galactonate dehydratase n=2 Tax=Paracoccus thiocyanatus TaxID=34006 RepID=A0A3D8PFN9_9RHOB|nr:altronate dehydratase family protein [Paracoccus thiocyanatus]RDW14078.1 galactonate dehydratase [Paracoccus thiocyanatus]
MTADFLTLDAADNVAIALRDLADGEILDGIKLLEAVPHGHKVARQDLAEGDPVLKFGQVIGAALAPIRRGAWVHSHNLRFVTGLARPAAMSAAASAPLPRRRTFMGYRRPKGRSGTRNYIGIIASVNCSTTVCRAIADAANRDLLPRFGNIDGFVPIVHGSGCGSSTGGEGQQLLQRTIAGYCRQPNFGGVLLVGLGCEVNQITLYTTGGATETRAAFDIQKAGGSRAAIAEALGILERIAGAANAQFREERPVSDLVLGLQCGGSDGFSGLTANPVLGRAVDLLVAAGGTAILSETPEIYGAEHLLTARASPDVAERLMQRIRWWEAYTSQHGASLDNNPSPGNKKGGLTTILEKSLGAVAKSGRSPLIECYGYAEQVRERGLVFMDTPGYDPVSATGQVAGGANLITFTTGRGSCFGCRPTPSLKVASTTQLFRQMPDDMDFDAGRLLADPSGSPDSLGAELYELLLDVASGQATASEMLGYGDNEFVPWAIGAVL